MNEFQIFYVAWRFLRHIWYKYRRKIMRFWDKLKWAMIGGFGYMLGRFLFEYLRQCSCTVEKHKAKQG